MQSVKSADITETKSLASVVTRDIPKVKEGIKSRLPNLTPADIRRYRLPYNEAVVAELREEGSHEAAEYFEFLFDLEEQTRRVAGPGTVIWSKPRLRDNKELVARLRKLFTTFCQRAIPASKRTINLMETAMYVQNLGWEWLWIADSLYRSAMWIAREMKGTDRELISVLRYVYARFLFYELKDAKTALVHVRVAHQDSCEKPWYASKILGYKQESLFRECCTLLQKILLTIARQIRDCEADVSVNSCKVALSAACQSGHEDSLAEAHHELGKSEIAAGNVKEAIKHFSRGLAVWEKIQDPLGICNAHSELVIAHKALGNHDQVLYHLDQYEEKANKFKLDEKLAEAHFLAGQYYLSQDDPKKATPNFELSLSIYMKIGEIRKANRVGCYVGVSRGEEMLNSYRALIIRSIKGDATALLNICLWRDRGENYDQSPVREKGIPYIFLLSNTNEKVFMNLTKFGLV